MMAESSLFPFPLDPFQQEAIAALDAGKSVVVVAPTGSGKTLIGEYAIIRALAQGKRVFYTTPLKALSNQKLRDFRQLFGVAQVGLLTGDISINRDAPILVMTTEIFRNILYGTFTDVVGTSLEGVEAVVLDECHYMNDRQRGTVWEESIIYCPPEIQLIALSATIANGVQLTAWIEWVHGATVLVRSDWRPVPLRFYFATIKGLFPLLDQQQQKINPRLKGLPSRHSGNPRQRKHDIPFPERILRFLQERDLLPAIYFIFSRRGCDKAVIATQDLSLVNPAEAQQLHQRVQQFLETYPELRNHPIVEGIYRGVAAHHAGLLPAWKVLIEELFQQGLIKVVFATETLAAGINMPARTTVISSLSKRTDLGHRLLTASEFLQMAGRAGRRGMDTLGNVVTLQTAFEGAKEAAYLATIGAEPLVSQFTPSYGMVLNLLQTHTLEESKQLIEKSFGQYLAIEQLAPQQQAIADIEQEITQLQQKLEAVDISAIQQYGKLQARLKEEQRLLKTLTHQAQEALYQEIAVSLPHLPFASAVLLNLSGSTREHRDLSTEQHLSVMPALFVDYWSSPGQLPNLLCLRKDNRWMVVSAHDILEIGTLLPLELETLTPYLPEGALRKRGDNVLSVPETAAVAATLTEWDWTPPAEVITQQARVQAVRSQLQSHPAHANAKQHGVILRWVHRLERLTTQLRDRQAKLTKQSQQRWQDFLRLVAVLRHFEALNELQPTALGKTAASLRGENELWLALSFTSGLLDDLAPHQFAAVCAALVAEPSRPDTWVRALPSPAVDQTLEALRPLRRKLIQIQHHEGVLLPVWLETEIIGIVEHWALETPWTLLCQQTSLDEGDIVRLLRRTLDVMSQIPHIAELSSKLHSTAYQAMQLINRFPVNEIESSAGDLDEASEA
jgi:superfamily II RNA helicase